MASKKGKASGDDYESAKPALLKALKAFYDDETAPVARPRVKALADVWDDAPKLDSKAVQRASPIVEEHLGFKLNGRFLKRGGYESFDELVEDLLPKLKSACTGAPVKRRAETPLQQPLQARSRKK